MHGTYNREGKAFLQDRLPTALLLACGFQAEEVPAEYEDVGGPESGPMIEGFPAHTTWSKEYDDKTQFVIAVEGQVREISTWDTRFLRYIDNQW